MHESLDISLTMAAAPRILVASGSISGLDHETFGSNETMSAPVHERIVLTQTDVPQNLINISKGWGGECRLEVTITARLQTDRRILAIINGKLYEGDSETTNDLDDEQTTTCLVPKGGLPVPFTMQLRNSGSGDTGTISLTFVNSLFEEQE
jgi:hypothetical protein